MRRSEPHKPTSCATNVVLPVATAARHGAPGDCLALCCSHANKIKYAFLAHAHRRAFVLQCDAVHALHRFLRRMLAHVRLVAELAEEHRRAGAQRLQPLVRRMLARSRFSAALTEQFAAQQLQARPIRSCPILSYPTRPDPTRSLRAHKAARAPESARSAALALLGFVC